LAAEVLFLDATANYNTPLISAQKMQRRDSILGKGLMHEKDGILVRRRCLGVMLSVVGPARAGGGAIETLKTEPPAGTARGNAFYVDDGTCSPGKIKLVTPGDRSKGFPRTRTCVKK
jgi:hypothetical protein